MVATDVLVPAFAAGGYNTDNDQIFMQYIKTNSKQKIEGLTGDGKPCFK